MMMGIMTIEDRLNLEALDKTAGFPVSCGQTMCRRRFHGSRVFQASEADFNRPATIFGQ
jgi:hypothetical protein